VATNTILITIKTNNRSSSTCLVVVVYWISTLTFLGFSSTKSTFKALILKSRTITTIGDTVLRIIFIEL